MVAMGLVTEINLMMMKKLSFR